MSKTLWHPQLVMLLVIKNHAHGLAKARRATPHIHHHIEHTAASTAHKLPLCLLQLIVQAPEHPLAAARLVVLHQLRYSGLPQYGPATSFNKEAASITMHLGNQQQHLGDGLGDDLHYFTADVDLN